ncbi:hypothetical protein E2C01_049370 [Portunus trituberculatus]|uniref:Uncharacterized protein n=1 Tax=Portunus trituberculatus TaxID=210409 RepID=A0A5B7GDI7_PORTR|nr:hypothetical protein [Portunus trituberculatus]
MRPSTEGVKLNILIHLKVSHQQLSTKLSKHSSSFRKYCVPSDEHTDRLHPNCAQPSEDQPYRTKGQNLILSEICGRASTFHAGRSSVPQEKAPHVI